MMMMPAARSKSRLSGIFTIELAGSEIFPRAPLWPQDATTRSPTFRSVTPAPTLSMMPATSAAGENGNGGLIWYLPWIIRMSKKFKAAALNFFDILMIQGKYQIKPPFPFSPAAEVAGIIESVGAGVTDLKVGDRVVASCGHNGARGKISLPANSIVKIPDNLDFDRAAGIIIIYGTTLHALEARASLKPGETMAVLRSA